MNVPQQHIPIIDPRTPSHAAIPWYDFFRSVSRWITERPTAIADGTYDVDGSASGTISNITVTDGVITGITIRP